MPKSHDSETETKPIDTKHQEIAEMDDDVGGGGGGGKSPPIDPIIAVLLQRLPKAGDVWPEAERKLWLDLLADSFKLIYKEATQAPTQLLVHE